MFVLLVNVLTAAPLGRVLVPLTDNLSVSIYEVTITTVVAVASLVPRVWCVTRLFVWVFVSKDERSAGCKARTNASIPQETATTAVDATKSVDQVKCVPWGNVISTAPQVWHRVVESVSILLPMSITAVAVAKCASMGNATREFADHKEGANGEKPACFSSGFEPQMNSNPRWYCAQSRYYCS